MPRIRIEDKHTYQNYNMRVDGNSRINGVLNPLTTFHAIEPYWPVQGTDTNNRIGRKIQVQLIHDEGFINLPQESGQDFFPNDTITDGWNGYMQDLMLRLEPTGYQWPADKTSYSVPIRHMWIEFYDDEFLEGAAADRGAYLAQWFKQLTVQIGNNADEYPSVQTKMLRESTPFTGKFKILKDTMYWLSPSKPEIHYNEDLVYVRNFSFETAEGADPTNAYIFSLWIGPTQPMFDYYNYGFGIWMNDSALNNSVGSFYAANIRGNMKMKYIDM